MRDQLPLPQTKSEKAGGWLTRIVRELTSGGAGLISL